MTYLYKEDDSPLDEDINSGSNFHLIVSAIFKTRCELLCETLCKCFLVLARPFKNDKQIGASTKTGGVKGLYCLQIKTTS